MSHLLAPNGGGDVMNSANAYIPEMTWDNSACALEYRRERDRLHGCGYDCYAADISAGSGGPSNCISAYSKTNTGVITCGTGSPSVYGYAETVVAAEVTGITPADGVRDIPDISFFASNGGPIVGGTDVSYVICQSDSNPQGSTTPTEASCNLSTPYTDFSLVGGTSAATPAFAAVMALVNQAQLASGGSGRQGNANYVLYNLAANDTNYTGGKCASSLGQTPAAGCVFNDVTKGNNAMACDAGTPNCSNMVKQRRSLAYSDARYHVTS